MKRYNMSIWKIVCHNFYSKIVANCHTISHEIQSSYFSMGSCYPDAWSLVHSRSSMLESIISIISIATVYIATGWFNRYCNQPCKNMKDLHPCKQRTQVEVCATYEGVLPKIDYEETYSHVMESNMIIYLLSLVVDKKLTTMSMNVVTT